MKRCAFALVLICVGCGDDDAMPDASADGGMRPDAGRDAGPPPGEDAGNDAGPLDAGPPVAGDDCSRAIDVAGVGVAQPDGTLVVATSDEGAHRDLEVCDPLLGGEVRVKDLVYTFVAPSAGRLRWEIDPGSPPALFTVDLRSTCDDPESNLLCDECPIRCIEDRGVEAGETLFFVITTILTAGGPDPGTFELRVRHLPFLDAGDACVGTPTATDRQCAPGLICQDDAAGVATCGTRVCGDGLIGFDTVECDDGNTGDGDGCSSTCEPVAQGAGGATCAEAVTLHVPRWRLGTLSPDVLYLTGGEGTMLAGSDFSASCAPTAGPEAFYAIDVAVPSRLELAGNGVEAVVVLDGCGGTELGCAMGTPPAAVSLEVARLDPGRYLVVLDRAEPTAAADASYSVELILTPL